MREESRPLLASAVFLAFGVALGMLMDPWVDDGSRAVCIVPALAGAILAQVPRVLALATARAIAWIYVVVGLGLAVGAEHATFAVTSIAGALVLIAMGPARYEACAEASGFVPVALRRSFLGALTGTSAVVLVLSVIAPMVAFAGHVEAGLVLWAVALGLVATAALVLRMRALGVWLGLFIAVLLASVGVAFDTEEVLALPAAGAGSFAVLVAIARWRPRVTTARSGRRTPWSSVVAGALACLAVAATIARADW